jgi:hypothetical protein
MDPKEKQKKIQVRHTFFKSKQGKKQEGVELARKLLQKKLEFKIY